MEVSKGRSRFSLIIIRVRDFFVVLFVGLVCLAGIALVYVIACVIFAFVFLVITEGFDRPYPLDP